MRFVHIGGASGILEHNGTRILFDPWLDDGIFHGAWYHYPPLVTTLDDLGHVDYIYISHVHEDHCSAGTLRHVNSDAELILMDRQPNLVLNVLRSEGLEFAKTHVVPPRSAVELGGGLLVDMVEPDPANMMSAYIDSMLVVEWDGVVVLNANDCQVWPGAVEYLAAEYPRIDLALLPHSGGSGYPACYRNLSDAEKDAETERIRESRADAFVDVVESLRPRMAVPFADQYVVAGSRSHLNRWVAHSPTSGNLRKPMDARGLLDRLVLLNPGQAVDLETGELSPGAFVERSEAERDEYVSSLGDSAYDHERLKLSAGISLGRLLHHARARLWAHQERTDQFSDWSIYLSTPEKNECFQVCLARSEVTQVGPGDELKEPYLLITGSRTLLVLLLLGHVSWNIADAALFLDYDRSPNEYDTLVYVLLNLLRM